MGERVFAAERILKSRIRKVCVIQVHKLQCFQAVSLIVLPFSESYCTVCLCRSLTDSVPGSPGPSLLAAGSGTAAMMTCVCAHCLGQGCIL